MIKIRLKTKLASRTRTGVLPACSFALVSALALLPAGCAVNPATGERQLILISERREIEMGREADQQIVAVLGLYDDAELQSYLQDLGAEMAGLSERPNLPWTFRVVDDPVVNAFALPGGFIYITRGIMVHLSSEAQLASVVGHEIGHVTGRHSVEQISRSQFFQVGLG
ncbi:MAG: M48 family metalloprotease, partial [Candidatus Acidoferrales bacterium]